MIEKQGAKNYSSQMGKAEDVCVYRGSEATKKIWGLGKTLTNVMVLPLKCEDIFVWAIDGAHYYDRSRKQYILRYVFTRTSPQK